MSNLTIIEDMGMMLPNEHAKRKRRYVKCLCNCGNEVVIRKDHFEVTKSCGCLMNVVNSQNAEKGARSYIGIKINRLTMVEDLGTEKDIGDRSARWILADCECGEVGIKIRFNDYKNEYQKSCGCLQKEIATENMRRVGKGNTTHGMDGTRIYRTWDSMKQRCNNSNAFGYEYYGGKGVAVCDSWSNSFEEFYLWAVSSGYDDNLTIDRVDPEGNYEPSNCQWLTKSENSIKMHKDKRSIS